MPPSRREPRSRRASRKATRHRRRGRTRSRRRRGPSSPSRRRRRDASGRRRAQPADPDRRRRGTWLPLARREGAVAGQHHRETPADERQTRGSESMSATDRRRGQNDQADDQGGRIEGDPEEPDEHDVRDRPCRQDGCGRGHAASVAQAAVLLETPPAGCHRARNGLGSHRVFRTCSPWPTVASAGVSRPWSTVSSRPPAPGGCSGTSTSARTVAARQSSCACSRRRSFASTGAARRRWPAPGYEGGQNSWRRGAWGERR